LRFLIDNGIADVQPTSPRSSGDLMASPRNRGGALHMRQRREQSQAGDLLGMVQGQRERNRSA
jgi:hypothetical protein